MPAQQFRKKPVVIEAMHLTQDISPDEVARWCGGRVVPHPDKVYTWGPLVVEIDTLEGVMMAQLGDWVIKGVANEFYPCKPEIFDATYEPVAPEDGETPDRETAP